MGPATLERLADLHAQLAEVYADLAKQERGCTQESDRDRVIGLEEAAARLGTTRSWLRRRPNWSRIPGAYLGADRRIHFPVSALAAYVHAQKH